MGKIKIGTSTITFRDASPGHFRSIRGPLMEIAMDDVKTQNARDIARFFGMPDPTERGSYSYTCLDCGETKDGGTKGSFRCPECAQAILRQLGEMLAR